MKNKILSFFAAILIVISVPAFLFAEEGAPEKEVIVEIQVKGNYAVSTATILNRVKVRPGDEFQESAVNKEIKRLYAMGYFSDVSVETQKHPDGVIVVFIVTEKPVIESIEFRGNSKIKTGRLSKKVLVKEGDLLDHSGLSRDMAEIKAYYVEQGYSRMTVDYIIETDRETGKAKVIFVINEGEPLKVRSVKVEGNKSIPAGELTKLMTTKTAWWFIRKGSFDEDKFEADLDRIRLYYRSKGFLDVKVASEREFSEDGKSLHLIILVDEGKRYQIGDITVTGTLTFPEEEIRKNIKAKSGDYFEYEKIKEDIDNIITFYYDRGYMDAEVDLERKYNPSTDRMDLVYHVNSHDVISVGKINIIGNTKTRDKVIRREMRVYPGEKYDGKKLRKSKERIYDLGFFEDVFFETVPTDQKDVKDLDVTVKETKTGELSFGGGYSSVDAFIGFAQIRQRNFDILDFPTFTGAGQDLIIRAELGSARNNYFVGWTDPWIFDYPFSFGFDVYREQYDRYGKTGYGYDETRTGGDLKLGKELTDEIYTNLVYNIEEVKISNIPDDATDDLRKEQGTNWISRLKWGIGYDTRDNKYSPTKGFVTGLSLENAGGFIGGDKDFVKGYTHGTIYHSLIKDIVLSVNGRVGLVENYGDSDEVPIYERFFAGGATTIRGYKQRGVGPRDRGSNSALGGESMAIGNVEVTFPIYKKLIKGAVFYDVGNVWAKYDDIFSTGGYKQGTGVGVRVKTPIGPVKVDWGYPLNKNYDDKREGQFYFSVSHGF